MNERMLHRICGQCTEEAGCWTWTGAVRRHGGGNRPAISMREKGIKHPVTGLAMHPKQHNVARIICAMFHGPAPTPEHEASHLCEDNWLCVHPWHLCWETKKENMARMWKRRRAEIDCDINAGVRADPAERPF